MAPYPSSGGQAVEWETHALMREHMPLHAAFEPWTTDQQSCRCQVSARPRQYDSRAAPPASQALKQESRSNVPGVDAGGGAQPSGFSAQKLPGPRA